MWDTGLGIPADQQRQVFEEFQRLDQGAQGGARPRPRPVDRRAARARARPCRSALRSKPRRGSVFASPRRWARGPARRGGPARAPSRSLAGEPLARSARAGDRQRAARARRHARAAGQMGLPRRHRPRPGRGARGAGALGGAPDVIIADYHLDDGDGLARDRRAARAASATPCRRSSPPPTAAPKCATPPPRADVALLNKPLKPAPLRALLTRCLALRVAAVGE